MTSGQETRKERLERELRANLRRRKDQARARRTRISAMDEADEGSPPLASSDQSEGPGDGAHETKP